MTSPFDEESLQIVKKLNPEYVKIASGEITNIPLLRSIGKLNKWKDCKIEEQKKAWRNFSKFNRFRFMWS